MEIFDIAVVGNANVGKSTLIETFVKNYPSLPYHGRIESDIRYKCININNKDIKIRFWEFKGYNFEMMPKINIYKRFHGIIICYDITNSNTFEKIKTYIEWLNINLYDIPKILIGTQSDLVIETSEDYYVPVNKLILCNYTGYYDSVETTYIIASRVKKIDAESIASEYNMPFYETSAKNNLNIQESIMDLIHRIILAPKKPETTITKNQDMIKYNIFRSCIIS